MINQHVSKRVFACVASGAAAFTLMAGSAFAQDAAGAHTRYQAEVARCNSGQSQQDRETCLKEAGAAQQEARKGELSGNVSASGYNGNAVARCEVFSGEELNACKARALGNAPTEGATITRGSVNEGGIIRESITIVPVPAEGQPAR